MSWGAGKIENREQGTLMGRGAILLLPTANCQLPTASSLRKKENRFINAAPDLNPGTN
jgi:hypothetical protein